MQKHCQWSYLNCLPVVLINIDPFSSILELGIQTFHHVKFLLTLNTIAFLYKLHSSFYVNKESLTNSVWVTEEGRGAEVIFLI